jgi:hypothetical protein
VDSWALGVAADGALDGAVSSRGEGGGGVVGGSIREELGVYGSGALAWVSAAFAALVKELFTTKTRRAQSKA